VILAKTPRLDFYKRVAPDFELVRCDIAEFGFAEQYSYVWKLYGIKNDLVHFAMTQQPILYFGDCITTIHDLTTARFKNPAKNPLVFSFKQIVYRWVVKRVAKKSKLIITPSKFVKKDVAQYCKIDPAKILVTNEAADKITAAAEPIPQLLSSNYLLYVGRAQPHKNLERLLLAYGELLDRHPDLKLVLAGKKDLLYSRLEKLAHKKYLTSQVLFTDFVSEGQLRWLYENCAAYVFPSLSEGFGLPGLEAMIHGAPVVSSNATCLPEVNGDAALYFDPLDAADIAAKIELVLSDNKLRQKLIKLGHQQVAKYSWRRMAEQTLEVYKAAIGKNT